MVKALKVECFGGPLDGSFLTAPTGTPAPIHIHITGAARHRYVLQYKGDKDKPLSWHKVYQYNGVRTDDEST